MKRDRDDERDVDGKEDPRDRGAPRDRADFRDRPPPYGKQPRRDRFDDRGPRGRGPYGEGRCGEDRDVGWLAHAHGWSYQQPAMQPCCCCLSMSMGCMHGHTSQAGLLLCMTLACNSHACGPCMPTWQTVRQHATSALRSLLQPKACIKFLSSTTFHYVPAPLCTAGNPNLLHPSSLHPNSLLPCPCP